MTRARRITSGKSCDVIAIVGPTAVGKTAVAVELVQSVGGEIVSADSMAVYVGMDIGTAKPTAEERSRAVFRLIDIVDPAERFCVAEFQRLAHDAIGTILRTNPPALVVGGSGLYVRAAIDGLGESVPGEDAALRNRLAEEARVHGSKYMHEQLARVDPASAGRIHPNNLKRVIRALEINELSGVPASVLFEADSRRARRYGNARFFGLTMDRKRLYARIEERVEAMIAAGLVAETSALLEKGVDPNATSMQGLGYREIVGYLRGDYALDEAVALIKKNTRRFAKRQYTWFNADPRVEWIDVDGLTAREVSNRIKELTQ